MHLNSFVGPHSVQLIALPIIGLLECLIDRDQALLPIILHKKLDPLYDIDLFLSKYWQHTWSIAFTSFDDKILNIVDKTYKLKSIICLLCLKKKYCKF